MADLLAIILGFLLGAAVSYINVTLLLKLSTKVANMPAKQSGYFVLGGYLVRILLYGGAIILSVLWEGMNPIATGVGILVVALFFTIKYHFHKS